ncbi:MAG: nucleotide pyrophosphohydrolase [Gammaproteobacteria bacterium]|nr:nucleotide pyrophosphohydrolase [Gammaproteobacteria bacterium]
MSDVFLNDLALQLRQFAGERDWEKFHNPKNLVMALAAECGELLEQFQWLTPEQSLQPDPQRLERIGAEMADVLVYLVRLADRLDLDLPAAVAAKLKHNRRKYPADLVRGDARKYDEYE